MRNGRLVYISAVILALAGTLPSCARERADEGEMPALLRRRLEAEMKTILHDVRFAEEQAEALEGRYLELDALRRDYFSRDVPAAYTLELTGVSAEGFRAEIVHKASGLRCHLEVGRAGPPGGGGPRCE